jgi:hypothetical protein
MREDCKRIPVMIANEDGEVKEEARNRINCGTDMFLVSKQSEN